MQTDISLSQFLAIQEKGVSAWEFEPELEIANCFVEARTEVEFFDSECSVQTNLPVPKQNDVYYWEAKIYDKPESTLISIGMTTKPYPLFRLPGMDSPSHCQDLSVCPIENLTFHCFNPPARLPQNFYCIPIDWPSKIQPTIHITKLWAGIYTRGRYWSWIPPPIWHNLLHA